MRTGLQQIAGKNRGGRTGHTGIVHHGGSVDIKHGRIGIGRKHRTGEQKQQHAAYHLTESEPSHSHTPLITILVTFTESYPPHCWQSMSFVLERVENSCLSSR